MPKKIPGRPDSIQRSGNGNPPPASPWLLSNCALGRLLASHRRVLGKAAAIAVEIGQGIDALAPSMASLCRRTCRFCPEPCCIANTVWFDFRDLLFFHLLEAPIPPVQAASDCKEPCPYLRHDGCLLTLQFRPWMCVQYLCPAQRAILRRQGRSAAAAMLGRIETIGKQRVRMETEVLNGIRQGRGRSSSAGRPHFHP